MKAKRRWALALFAVPLITPELSRAHDFESGPTMGMPPRVSEVGQRLLQLIPAGLDEPAQRRVRGVIDRAQMWPQNQELKVCFLSGTQRARARVAAAAVEWTNYVNLRLNFGDMTNPQICTGNGTEHIKIDFLISGPDSGHWSYVGIDSWQFPHSMNLHGFGGDALTVTDEDFRGVVLHEFGHAFGFAHEHQSPSSNCEAEFDPAKVAAWAKRMGWSEADVKTNLAKLQPSSSLVFTRHDRESILHYSLPVEFFRDGKNNRCWVPKNNVLSAGDKAFAASMYPPAVASLETEGTSGGAVRLGLPAGETSANAETTEIANRADLRRSFKETLTEGGLVSSEAEGLAAKFQDEIANLRSGPGR